MVGNARQRRNNLKFEIELTHFLITYAINFHSRQRAIRDECIRQRCASTKRDFV